MADDQRSRQYKQTIETCLAEGFAPFRQTIPGSRGSAVREAARRLGVNVNTVTSWVGWQERVADLGGEHRLPDWTLFGRAEAPRIDPQWAEPIPADPVEVRRLTDTISALRGQLKEVERRAAAAEDIRSGLLGLDAVQPRRFAPDPGSPHGRQAVILHISDLHAGEVISAREILGANRYNLDIFRDRMGRLFNAAAQLATRHWPRDDNPPDEMVVALGGDLVSGSIHPELAETNAGTDYQIFREVAEHIAGGIELLRAETGLPIRVYSVPGNHGRQTLKPQTKRQGLQSWDILVADFAEAALRHDADVEWTSAEGTDCYFDVLGWPILLTHGHAMGTGGGQGFVGPAAPIIRGHQKVSHTELRQGRAVYLILSAHYHTTIKTPWGWSNGSVVGYNEFVRHHRGEPEPAQQNMFVLHERRGLIRWQPLYVGAPSEGSLYQGWRGGDGAQ